MLLRASSEKAGAPAQLAGAIGQGAGGVAHGAELTRFGEAVTRGSDDVDAARAALIDAVGPDGFVEAASIVGICNGLVRTADATGIPLDDGTRATSVDFRAELGLNAYAGAANTQERDTPPPAGDDVEGAFR